MLCHKHSQLCLVATLGLCTECGDETDSSHKLCDRCSECLDQCAYCRISLESGRDVRLTGAFCTLEARFLRARILEARNQIKSQAAEPGGDAEKLASMTAACTAAIARAEADIDKLLRQAITPNTKFDLIALCRSMVKQIGRRSDRKKPKYVVVKH